MASTNAMSKKIGENLHDKKFLKVERCSIFSATFVREGSLFSAMKFVSEGVKVKLKIMLQCYREVTGSQL
ncbi:hypothetical protein SAE01_14680 [Segetibacter aerophilus]|uniref:Uncharacterized protein n=1 Tax=Segetibacter aerophilus TaxID=670293 RepID=A0A512BAI3_9BACT|nr:hypothetical protein SAE01_14680 [Segetibacter aerophilus]